MTYPHPVNTVCLQTLKEPQEFFGESDIVLKMRWPTLLIIQSTREQKQSLSESYAQNPA
jgi:hypothetical protein